MSRFISPAWSGSWKGEGRRRKIWKRSGYRDLRRSAIEEGTVCHGEYNQHNVLMLRGSTAVTNFEKWSFDVPTADLYRFMRKVLEKNNWDVQLAREMLRAYHRQRKLSWEEIENLRIRFSYPEKYWKLGKLLFYSPEKLGVRQKHRENTEACVSERSVAGF